MAEEDAYLWGPKIGTDKENLPGCQGEEIKALQRFFLALEEQPILFFTLQILWLKSEFPNRLGKELSGRYGEGEVASTQQAAVTLYRIARLQYKQVNPLGQHHLPLIEGLIRFQRATYSFLPQSQPALFVPAGRVITLTQLIGEGRAPDQAVNFLLRRLRGVK